VSAPAASASSVSGEVYVTVTVTETTLLSIPFPQATASASTTASGAQLLSGIVSNAAVNPTKAEMLAAESMPAEKEAVIKGRHFRHVHHARGLHDHGHMHFH